MVAVQCPEKVMVLEQIITICRQDEQNVARILPKGFFRNLETSLEQLNTAISGFAVYYDHPVSGIVQLTITGERCKVNQTATSSRRYTWTREQRNKEGSFTYIGKFSRVYLL